MSAGERASFDRYLALLGVARRPPALAALAELTRAQLTRVPFENVSKLLRHRAGRPPLPDLAEHLDGIERHHLGGTCYANNHHLHGLLVHLGYDARLCGADMSQPDVHLVCLVTVEGREVIVDGGYGAPFLEPMPRDLDCDHAIALGRDAWVLHPREADGRSRLDHLRDGAPRHGYRVNPAPRRIEEFAKVIADSFRPDATFLNALMIARFSPGRSRVLRNLELVESAGERSTVERVSGPAALPALIEERFEIPAALVAAAIAGLGLTGEI